MSIVERLMNWWEQGRIRQKAAEEDAASLIKLLGDGAYGEASRRASNDIREKGLRGQPKGHWAAVKDTIARLERIY
jgi:hypothetical protein